MVLVRSSKEDILSSGDQGRVSCRILHLGDRENSSRLEALESCMFLLLLGYCYCDYLRASAVCCHWHGTARTR